MAKEKDTLTKAFMERPDVFADAFNFLIYGGKPVIRPEELEEMDTTAISLPFGLDGTQASVQKIRDVFKGLSDKPGFAGGADKRRRGKIPVRSQGSHVFYQIFRG